MENEIKDLKQKIGNLEFQNRDLVQRLDESENLLETLADENKVLQNALESIHILIQHNV